MKKSFAIALLLSASVNAYAVDGGAVVGGAVGGAAGAAIGYQMGGKTGAILGGAIGGGTGAAVGARPDAPAVQAAPVRRVSVRDREDEEGDRHHDNGRHRGHDKHKHHHED